MTHVAVWRGDDSGICGFWHHGVRLSDGSIVHYCVPSSKSLADATIRRTLPELFAADPSLIHVFHYQQDVVPEEAEQRALSMVGAKGYNLVTRNCETFATWCFTGRGESRQVQGAIMGSCVGVMCSLAGVHPIAAFFSGLATGHAMVQATWPKKNVCPCCRR